MTAQKCLRSKNQRAIASRRSDLGAFAALPKVGLEANTIIAAQANFAFLGFLGRTDNNGDQKPGQSGITLLSVLRKAHHPTGRLGMVREH